ncbi:MAG: hypothetical protein WA126_13600 [Thermodesulfovibrionales bacterium]
MPFKINKLSGNTLCFIISHWQQYFHSIILSFPGLTVESRKALDARLRTSGMTNKDNAYYLTED